MSYQIYPKQLINVLKNNKLNYVPRLLINNDLLKLYHKYWIPEYDDPFKVEEIIEYENQIYYCIKFLTNKRYAVICQKSTNRLYYELYKNTLDKNKNIINDNKYYIGSEIRYWFYKNNILDDNNYRCCIPYMIMNGMSRISDDKIYTVNIIFNENNNTVDCRFKLKYKSR